MRPFIKCGKACIRAQSPAIRVWTCQDRLALGLQVVGLIGPKFPQPMETSSLKLYLPALVPCHAGSLRQRGLHGLVMLFRPRDVASGRFKNQKMPQSGMYQWPMLRIAVLHYLVQLYRAIVHSGLVSARSKNQVRRFCFGSIEWNLVS
jgi:hypothetical protein